MKKSVIIATLLITCIIILLVVNRKEKKKDNDIECDVFQNNKYSIIFHSNGGPEIETLEICDDCNRSEDNSLPVIAKKDYNFEGWYYDSLFLMKADVKTIDELNVSIEKNNEGCDYKYKDINLYALWTKI